MRLKNVTNNYTILKMPVTIKTLFFDTETTGLLKPMSAGVKAQPRCIEVAFERIGPDPRKFKQLINPLERLDKKITDITGLTDSDLKGKPIFTQVSKPIQKIIEGANVIVAHNLVYDRTVLDCEFARLHYVLKWPKRQICTVEATEHLFGRRARLGELYEHLFGKPIEDAHRAMSDVKALKRIYLKLLDEGEIAP